MDNHKALRVVMYTLAGAAVLIGLYLCSLYSYPLFYVISQIFSVAVAFAIFLITWNCRHVIRDNYTSFIGISFLFIGCLDLAHTLAYQGMVVFPSYDANISSQLWIASRYCHSISFVIAALFISRKVKPGILAAGYLVVMAATLLSIFYWHNFPDCFIEGIGLTSCKIISEYIIIGLFALAILLLVVNRKRFQSSIVFFMAFSLTISIASELAFTLNPSSSGLLNLMGHYLKIVAFYLIYRALVKSQLIDPYSTLFRELTQNEKTLNRALETAKIRTKEVISLLNVTRTALASKSFRETAQITLNSCSQLIGTQGGYMVLFAENNGQKHEIIAATSTSLQGGIEDEIINKMKAKILDRMQAVYDNTGPIQTADIILNNIIGAPLSANGKAQGILFLINKDSEFIHKDARLLSAFAELASIGLQNSRAVSDLRNQRKRLENILNSMQDAVYIVNQDYKIEYANPAMLNIFGEQKGQKCYEYVCESTKPCSNCRFSEIVKGKIIHQEFSAKNDRTYDVIYAPIISPETRAISKLKIMRDITEIKQALEEVQNLAKFPSENPFPVLRISSRGVVLYANNTSSGLLRHWDMEKEDKIPASWQTSVDRALATGECMTIEEKLGNEIISFAITPVKGNEYVNVYGRNITEYRDFEKQLQHANLELEQRVEERTQQLQETINELGEEVSERLQTEEELVTNQNRLRALSSEMMLVAERERREIASQLHDSIGQLLAFSKKELGVLIKSAPDNIRVQLRYVWDLIKQSVEQTRNLSFHLTSATLYTVGLEAALEEMAEDCSEVEDFFCHFTGCEQAYYLPEQIQISLYRAVRELLVNTSKHAKAKNVWLSLGITDDNFQIVVKDDGIGFNVDDSGNKIKSFKSFGLFSLKERMSSLGGSLVIRSFPGQGTKITITTPLKIEVREREEQKV